MASRRRGKNFTAQDDELIAYALVAEINHISPRGTFPSSTFDAIALRLREAGSQYGGDQVRSRFGRVRDEQVFRVSTATDYSE